MTKDKKSMTKDEKYDLILSIIVVTSMFVLLIFFMSAAFLWADGYNFNTSNYFTNTVIVNYSVSHTGSGSGWGFVDMDGNGYIESIMILGSARAGNRYNITYFCDRNDIRKVIFLESYPLDKLQTELVTTVPTYNIYQCRSVNGTCI